MGPMRLAWFSPLPPVRSGVAACSAELVDALRDEHEIDTYVDRGGAGPRQPAGLSAHDFIWRHRRRPYDLTIYQLGNSSNHDYEWPYLFRYPGLAVLHDAHLHHARAASLLRMTRTADYRAEFAAAHPELPLALAELTVKGYDNHLYYLAPMTRLIVQTSRLTAVHTPALAAALTSETPGAAVEAIHLGHGVPLPPEAAAEARRRTRSAAGLPRDAVVFGVFGGLTPEKRLPQILDAFRAVLPYCPAARLLLVGAPASHYDVRADVAAHGLSGHASFMGYLEHEDELTDAIAASDVALTLRWPTAREVSGPWLRALAAGVPTVTIDLEHTWHVPSLDPRTWRPTEAGRSSRPVTVAIDILDEDHSLRLAMRRLAFDAVLRGALAEAGREYWQREHATARMLDDYRRIIARAAARPIPRVDLPPHLVDDGDRRLRALLHDVGVESAVF
jgi:glycosyltransferase involved in cell wall biosynthesis